MLPLKIETMINTLKNFYNWLTEITPAPVAQNNPIIEKQDRQIEQLEAKIQKLEKEMEHLRYQPKPSPPKPKVTKEDIMKVGIDAIVNAKRTEDKMIAAAIVGAYLLYEEMPKKQEFNPNEFLGLGINTPPDKPRNRHRIAA